MLYYIFDQIKAVVLRIRVISKSLKNFSNPKLFNCSVYKMYLILFKINKL